MTAAPRPWAARAVTSGQSDGARAAATDAIEQAGRDGQVTGRREGIRHGADVMIDAEDLLADHHGTACAARGGRQPGIEFMTIAGHECRELTHEVSGERSTRGAHCATGRAGHLSFEGNI